MSIIFLKLNFPLYMNFKGELTRSKSLKKYKLYMLPCFMFVLLKTFQQKYEIKGNCFHLLKMEMMKKAG